MGLKASICEDGMRFWAKPEKTQLDNTACERVVVEVAIAET